MVKKILNKIGSNFAALALIVGMISTTQSCHYFLNQPKVPENMRELISKQSFWHAK